MILLYPNGQRREVILDGIPGKDDTILLKNETVPLVVEHVLWMETGGPGGRARKGPQVLLSVRAAPQ